MLHKSIGIANNSVGSFKEAESYLKKSITLMNTLSDPDNCSDWLKAAEQEMVSVQEGIAEPLKIEEMNPKTGIETDYTKSHSDTPK